MLSETDINRFIEAQKNVYDHAIIELQKGKKTSHWMWFIFPQIKGLGFSDTSKYYSIKSIEEANEYMSHPVLRERLMKCCDILLHTHNKTAHDIFWYPDDLKLHSSITLFSYLFPSEKNFSDVLKKFFQNKKDEKTISILKTMENG